MMVSTFRDLALLDRPEKDPPGEGWLTSHNCRRDGSVHTRVLAACQAVGAINVYTYNSGGKIVCRSVSAQGKPLHPRCHYTQAHNPRHCLELCHPENGRQRRELCTLHRARLHAWIIFYEGSGKKDEKMLGVLSTVWCDQSNVGVLSPAVLQTTLSLHAFLLGAGQLVVLSTKRT